MASWATNGMISMLGNVSASFSSFAIFFVSDRMSALKMSASPCRPSVVVDGSLNVVCLADGLLVVSIKTFSVVSRSFSVVVVDGGGKSFVDVCSFTISVGVTRVVVFDFVIGCGVVVDDATFSFVVLSVFAISGKLDKIHLLIKFAGGFRKRTEDMDFEGGHDTVTPRQWHLRRTGKSLS